MRQRIIQFIKLDGSDEWGNPIEKVVYETYAETYDRNAQDVASDGKLVSIVSTDFTYRTNANFTFKSNYQIKCEGEYYDTTSAPYYVEQNRSKMRVNAVRRLT